MPHSCIIFMLIFVFSLLPIVGHAIAYSLFCCFYRVTCSIYWGVIIVTLEIVALLGEVDENMALFVVVYLLGTVHILYIMGIAYADRFYVIPADLPMHNYAMYPQPAGQMQNMPAGVYTNPTNQSVKGYIHHKDVAQKNAITAAIRHSLAPHH